MAKQTMTVRGREIGFYFDTRAWLQVEARFGSMGEMARRLDEDEKPLETSLALACITANAYQRKNGLPEDFTEDWLTDNFTPRQMSRAIYMAKNAYIVGMQRETEDDDTDEDAVLAELEKKTDDPSAVEE